MLSSATAVAVVVVAIALAAFFVKALSSAFLLASKALSYFDGCLEAAFALAATASYMLVAKNNYSQYTQMDKKLLSASISIGNGF